MATLRELTNDQLRLMALLADPETSSEELQDTIEMVEGDFQDKVEAYCIVRAQMLSDAEDLEAEGKRLLERAKALKTGAARKEEWLMSCMLATGQRKLQTLRYTVSIRKSSSVEIDNMEDVPFECLKIADPTADKTKIKDYIKNNGPVTWAHIAEHDNISIK